MQSSTSITLTEDQQKAFNAFVHFLSDPLETVFVLSGYSGTGKSTLVGHIIDRLPGVIKTLKLINPSQKDYEVTLTATTNKAAENLSDISGMPVSTIHSFLELNVQTNYSTGATTLTPRNLTKREGYLLFIDEASYVDKTLLHHIFSLTTNCKIVFMGDPAQLTPVKSKGTPVFESGFPEARLTQVVRQAEGNPIVDLSTMFRNTVTSGEFFSFTPDGVHVQHMTHADFYDAIVQDFTAPGWKYRDSKILAWTNARVIVYNHFVSDKVSGNPTFQIGDYAVCNQFCISGRSNIKTDQTVYISNIEPAEVFGVQGNYYDLDNGKYRVFGPSSLTEWKEFIKNSKQAGQLQRVQIASEHWIDLRAAYACTINKAQGSTYDRVYIDLDDIRRCNSGDQIARMLYVAVSRARHKVFLTGDIA